jgi:hypothetical protein
MPSWFREHWRIRSSTTVLTVVFIALLTTYFLVRPSSTVQPGSDRILPVVTETTASRTPTPTPSPTRTRTPSPTPARTTPARTPTRSSSATRTPTGTPAVTSTGVPPAASGIASTAVPTSAATGSQQP